MDILKEERKAKVSAIKNELASYFEVLVNDGYAKPNTMTDTDYTYLANKVLTSIDEVEIEFSLLYQESNSNSHDERGHAW